MRALSFAIFLAARTRAASLNTTTRPPGEAVRAWGEKKKGKEKSVAISRAGAHA
jgi:hypothetical protein